MAAIAAALVLPLFPFTSFLPVPDSASLPGPASSASEPAQAAKTTAPLGCLRQATASVPAGAIIPQPTCKANVCPGNCRHKQKQDAI